MTKPRHAKRTYLLAICFGSGMSSLLPAQNFPSTAGWLPRTTELPQPQPRPRYESTSELFSIDSVGNRPQPGASIPANDSLSPSKPALNWIPSGQIPTSPWDRASSPVPAAQRPLPRNLPGAPANPAASPSIIEQKRAVGPASHRTIYQPASANVSSSSVVDPRSSELSFIGQPQVSDRSFVQIPAGGQPLPEIANQPIVDLGWPIPVDTMVSSPSSGANPNRQHVPLEANRSEPSGPSQGPQRSARKPEPTPNEVGMVDADYVTTAPSSVVGIVAVPGKPAAYSRDHEDRPMNTFVPSHDAHQNNMVHAILAQSERDASRMRLASQISRELMEDGERPMGIAPVPVEPPMGWKSVEEEIRGHLSKCDELLKRNAVMSARDEVLTGLRVLYRALDLRSGGWSSEPTLDQALSAFSEEADFQQSLLRPTHAQSTARIVAGHATQALKQVDLKDVSPELAAQHYRTYARHQLAIAAQGHPWAADLIYALGKTYEQRAEANGDNSVMFRNQAAACYAAALDIAPGHADGANQLGYTLLRLDRLDEAQTVLSQSLQYNPSANAWKNLAEVYRRREQPDMVAFALQQVAILEGHNTVDGLPEVIQIDPQTFARISPNQQIKQGTVTSASAVSPSVPPKSTSWFSRLLR
ncbi:MAG: hypothetical protein SGI77_25100 [Pirellulaceae bacterium]|nr:hypothetical protein [Pirellulaceae bacterium]